MDLIWRQLRPGNMTIVAHFITLNLAPTKPLVTVTFAPLGKCRADLLHAWQL